jgi:hypothetical protein
VQFSLQVSYILEELVFFAVVVSVVKADEPPGADAMELIVDEVLDISLETLGLLSLFCLYLVHLSFYCFFSRRSTGTPFGIQHISSVSCSQLSLLNPPSKHCRQSLFMQVAGFTGSAHEDLLTLKYLQAKPTRATLHASLFLLPFSCCIT